MRAFVVLLLLAAVVTVGLTAPLDHKLDEQPAGNVVRAREKLRFPPQFYAIADYTLNADDFEKELHKLAWYMCENYRTVKAEKKELQRQHRGRRHPKLDVYESLLRSNPMEPAYHKTCLALFRLYPNMSKDFQPEITVLPVY